MKKKMIPIFISFVFLVIINIILFGSSYKSSDLVVITDKNNYSYRFARSNNLSAKIENIEEEILYDFSYVLEEDSITITSYKGVSEKLVIPNMINGYNVTKIITNAFLNSKVKDVYIGSNISSYEDGNKINIHCYNNSYCSSLSNSNYNIINEEESVDFNYKDILYDYSIYGNEIELTRYKGESKDLVIPEYINGYKVVSISFNLEGYDSVTIPSSIRIINNNFKYDKGVFIASIISIISYIVFVLVTLFVIKDNNKKNKLYVVSVLYLLIEFMLCYRFYGSISKFLIYSFILFVIYIVFVVVINVTKKKKLFRIKNSNYYDDVTYELKKYKNKNYKKIEKLVLSSKDNSNVKSLDIEKEIVNRVRDLRNNNTKNDISTINELIRKRNIICKCKNKKKSK